MSLSELLRIAVTAERNADLGFAQNEVLFNSGTMSVPFT